ncbi:MAG: hypothetical protein A2539_08005 [Elusimicrobia bacterium RIFOXYD2_FULL_34_15]|nr:MAG: hypothetical protein A2539_08005 [Elusimicrobia bacterium RIFOXYD2_FULL_34_15]
MKYAVFSDIHSNLDALKTVLAEISKEKVDEYICCGDIVGYGPEPNECIDEIKKIKNIKIVAGNHDRAVVDRLNIDFFHENAKEVIIWTSSVLTQENKEFLTNLPEKIIENNFTVVHGSPRDPINEYLMGVLDINNNLSYFENDICFIGHTHLPFFYAEGLGSMQLKALNKMRITSKSIINVGSIGQPRDSDNRACYMIIEDNAITCYRVPYDIESVQKKMKGKSLPKKLITRLSCGA